MSDREERFQVDGQPTVSLRVPVGDVRVDRGEPGEVLVRLRGSERDLARYLIEQRGDTITIEPQRGGMGRWSAVSVLVEVGDPAELRARLAAADLKVAVPLVGLEVDTASGDMAAGDVDGDVRIKSASGDVQLGDVSGSVDVATASGDLAGGAIEESLSVKTASGDVDLGTVAGDVVMRSASGDLDIRVFTGDDLDAKTMSGDVTLGVTPGRVFEVSFQTMSGDVRTDFPVSSDGASGSPARLTVRSMSGDVTIHSAG